MATIVEAKPKPNLRQCKFKGEVVIKGKCVKPKAHRGSGRVEKEGFGSPEKEGFPKHTVGSTVR